MPTIGCQALRRRLRQTPGWSRRQPAFRRVLLSSPPGRGDGEAAVAEAPESSGSASAGPSAVQDAIFPCRSDREGKRNAQSTLWTPTAGQLGLTNTDC